jgi:hypothetical protein
MRFRCPARRGGVPAGFRDQRRRVTDFRLNAKVVDFVDPDGNSLHVHLLLPARSATRMMRRVRVYLPDPVAAVSRARIADRPDGCGSVRPRPPTATLASPAGGSTRVGPDKLGRRFSRYWADTRRAVPGRQVGSDSSRARWRLAKLGLQPAAQHSGRYRPARTGEGG